MLRLEHVVWDLPGGSAIITVRKTARLTSAISSDIPKKRRINAAASGRTKSFTAQK